MCEARNVCARNCENHSLSGMNCEQHSRGIFFFIEIYLFVLSGYFILFYANTCSLIHCNFGNGLVLVMDLLSEGVLVGRLNGEVSLVTVLEELSHVTSPFWSGDKENQGILLFLKNVLRTADVVVRSIAVSTWSLPFLFSRSEKKWFPSSCCEGLLFVHWTPVTLV